MQKPIYVIGTGLSHDGSACLLKDGRVRFAIEKERVTRKKHDGGNDLAAIQYLLAAEGITPGDVALVVQNANFGMLEAAESWLDGPRPAWGDVPVVTISHHLAHAYGAFGTCPFDEAAVMVVDGCGNSFDDCIDLDGTTIPETPPQELASLWNEKDSYYRIAGTRLEPLYKDFSPWGAGMKNYPMHPPSTRHSIGGVYAAVSKYVFRGLEDPGKLMGLAPYGRPGIHDFPVFDLSDGRVFVRYDWMKDFRTPAHSQDAFKADFQRYADLAWWIQREVERALLYVIRARHDFSPSPNLCYTGGVALNAVANRIILRDGPFENVFFQPAAGDNGLALGCAFYGWLEVLKKDRVRHAGSVYFGRSYGADEIEGTLARYAELVEITAGAAPVDEAVTALAAGKVVGWFQGGSEFGPRALGNRSILADPRLPHIRDAINAKVKFREDFRPFAPSVLVEDCNTYFDCDHASPHMLLTAPVRPEWRDIIPAVVHRDGSARIQTVTHQDNALYHDLLAAFRDKTGLGVLLNTSLNRRGMPIVETPDDAMMLFLYSAIDVLVIGTHVIRKPDDFVQRIAGFNRMVAQASARKTFEKALAS
ncbi:MAG: transferase [Alphaproteobacteria bacterium]|nr:transferase [Alphaproteobacteria bacterium]